MATGNTPAAVAAPNDWQDVKQPSDWQDVAPKSAGPTPSPSSAAMFGAGGQPPAPGFMTRLGQAVGIPTSMDELKAMAPPKPTLASAAENLLVGPAAPLVNNIIGQGKQMVSNMRGGSPATTEIPKFILNGPLGPVGGGAVNSFAEDLGGHMNANPGHPIKAAMHGDVAGDLLGSVINLLTLKGAAGPSNEARINSLTAAAGAKASTPIERLAKPLLDTADSAGIKPQSLGDVRTVVNKFKDNINTEYGNAIGPHANMQMFPEQVSQRIMGLITPDMQYTAEGRAEMNAIKNAALEYEKPWTLGALDSKRSRLAADLASHNSKESVGRYTAERGNINLAVDNATMDALRDTVYPQADALAGKPAGYFEGLKQQQSDAIRLQSILNKRIEDLMGKSRESKGQPPLSRMRPGAAIGEGGVPHGYLSNLPNVIAPRDVLKSADKAAAKGFSTGGPVSQAMVLSYPARWALMQQPMTAAPNQPPQ